MKKWIARVLTALLVLSIALNINLTNVSAAEPKVTFSVSLSKTDAMVGDEITATITMKSSNTILQAEFEFTYDSSKLKYKSCDSSDVATTDPDGVIPFHHDSEMDETTVTYSVVFKAKAAGDASFSFANATVPIDDDSSDDGVSQAKTSFGSASVKIWAEGSDDATLKRLEVSGAKLNPAFSAGTLQYTAWVSTATTSVTISADPNNADATTKMNGDPNNLQYGANWISFTVQAPNGATKKYSVNVYREPQPKPTEPPTTTEEPTTTTVEETTTAAPDTVEVTWNNQKYYLSNGYVAEQIPEGFAAEELTYKNQKIMGIKNQTTGLCLYYLISLEAEEETTEPENSGSEMEQETTTASEPVEASLWGAGSFYLYNETADDFYPYQVLTIQDKGYVIAPLSWAGDAPANMVVKSISVYDHVFDSYIHPNNVEFAYFCALNAENKYVLYSLDLVEVTVQRMNTVGVSSVDDGERLEQMSSMADEIVSLQGDKSKLEGVNTSLTSFRNLLVIGAGSLIFIMFVLLIYLFVRETLRLKKEKAATVEEETDDEPVEIEEIDFDDDEAFSVDAEESDAEEIAAEESVEETTVEEIMTEESGDTKTEE